MLHDRYQIVQVIGQGTTGTVYLADDLQRERPVAIRELRPGRPTAAFHPADIRLFQREAFAFQGLRHPNLSRVHGFLKGSHACYLVMDFVEGRPLSDVLAHEGPQYEAAVLDWVQQLCGALRYLHARRPPVILRELGPSNVVLRDDGLVRIVDFGIARSCGLGIGFDRRSGTRGMSSGGFRAPGGEWMPDVLSNVYSLGALIHCLLTGDIPATAQDAARSSPGFVDLRRVRPDVSEETVRVVEAMLHPDRTARPAGIDDVLHALGLAIEEWNDTGEDLDDPPPRVAHAHARLEPAVPAPVADPGLELFLARAIRVDPGSGPCEPPPASHAPRAESPEPLALTSPTPPSGSMDPATSPPSARPAPSVPPPLSDDPAPGIRPPHASTPSTASVPPPREEVLEPGSLPADSEFAAAVKSALAASAPVQAAARPPKAELAAAVRGAVAASASARAAARVASKARAQAPAPVLPLSRAAMVAAVVAVVLVGGWWMMRGGSGPTGPAAATVLEVTSIPAGARVFVDDTERGVTPLRLTPIGPGRHDLRVESPSHVTARYMLQLREGRTRTMRVVLQKEGESPVTVPPPPPGVDDAASPTPEAGPLSESPPPVPVPSTSPSALP